MERGNNDVGVRCECWASSGGLWGEDEDEEGGNEGESSSAEGSVNNTPCCSSRSFSGLPKLRCLCMVGALLGLLVVGGGWWANNAESRKRSRQQQRRGRGGGGWLWAHFAMDRVSQIKRRAKVGTTISPPTVNTMALFIATSQNPLCLTELAVAFPAFRHTAAFA